MKRIRSRPVSGALALATAMVGSLMGAAGIGDQAWAAAATDPITKAAGGGVEGYEDDGFSATRAWLRDAIATDVDSAGNIYIVETTANRIRMVDTAGIITTVAGTGWQGSSGDGGPATEATIDSPSCVHADDAGGFYICDNDSHKIRKVDASGTITTVAGSGEYGDGGDGGPAVDASIRVMGGLALSPTGDLYFADPNSYRVRKVDTAGVITTVAGVGLTPDFEPAPGETADGGQAVAAQLRPQDVAVDGDGNLYIAAETKVRKVDAAGVITTVAGTGEFVSPPGFLGEGGPATEASIEATSVSLDASGNVYIGGFSMARVLKVDTFGIITSVVGHGENGTGGDNGPAGAAQVDLSDVVSDSSGTLYTAEMNKLRRTGPEGLVLSESHTPAQVRVGNQVTRTFTVTNLAPTPATSVRIVDTRSNALAFTAGKSKGCVSSTSVVTCALGTIAPGATRTATITSTAVRSGAARSATTVTSTEVDPHPRNNTVVFPLLVSASGCGQVMTRNTVLKDDLGPCEGTGIVVGAGGITLNLDGHKVHGFPGPSGPAGSAAGIRIEDRTGVTVKNGTVADFDAGVYVLDGGSHTLTNLTARDNIGPDDVFNSEFGDGILVYGSTDNTIARNLILHNGVFDGIGIYGPGADDNVIEGNVVADNQGPTDGGASGQGIIVNASTASGPVPTILSRTRVAGNVVRDNGSAGIANINHIAGHIVGNIVEGNGRTNSVGNGIGVQVGPRWTRTDPMLTVVEGNEVHGNAEDGIQVRRDANGNQIRNNNAAGNAQRAGFDLRDLNAACGTNTWTGNTWGAAGFTPACTGTGGSPAVTSTSAAAASTSMATVLADPLLKPQGNSMSTPAVVRRHPGRPGVVAT